MDLIVPSRIIHTDQKNKRAARCNSCRERLATGDGFKSSRGYLCLSCLWKIIRIYSHWVIGYHTDAYEPASCVPKYTAEQVFAQIVGDDENVIHED